MRKFWRTRSAPTAEAQAARAAAGKASAKADAVYGERRLILEENHFAERIRLIYEGR